MHASVQQAPFGTTAIIYVAVIALIVWRIARPQRTSVLRLWIMPVILLLLTAFSIWANLYAAAAAGHTPPPGWEIAAVLVVGAALGVPLGFLRGRHTTVKPADRPGVMYVHSSPLIVIIWIAAFVARAAVRAYLPHAQAGAALGSDGAALGSDGLLAFAMAALITSYYAIYTKYRAAMQHAPAS